jgi:steroid 5-alpha reductase family enzyme
MTGLELLTALAVMALALFVIMAASWFVQDCTGHAGWIDAFWTFGVGLVGVAAAMTPLDFAPPHRNLLVAVLAFTWSARLGVHIARRNLRTPDDPRYAKIRAGYGTDARAKMFWLTEKQALVSIPLVLAIYLAAHNPDVQMRWQDIAGLIIMVVSIAGEAAATCNCAPFSKSRRTRDASATRGCGDGRAIPTISSSGSHGFPIRSSPSSFSENMSGLGFRCWHRR